jgi:hypothetical protein
MKKQNYIFSTIFVMFILTNSAQAWHVNIYGNTSLCAGTDFIEFYTISHNVQWVSTTSITVTGGNIIGINGTPITATTTYGVSRTVPGSMEIQWTQGASVKRVLVEVVSSWASIKTTKDLYCYEIYNDPIVTLNSSVPSLTCGSTNPITFTAYWSIANSYSWSVSGGSKGSDCNAGSSTCTVTPYSTTTALNVQVTGINNACGFTRNVYKNLYLAPPSVTEIQGPSEVCLGSTGIVPHSVNYISGVDYKWFINNNLISGATNRTIYVNSNISGQIVLKVKVTDQCGNFSEKQKTVYATNDPPEYVYLSEFPYQHCAGSCEMYSLDADGSAVEFEWRSPDLGETYWQNLGQYKDFTICSYDSYDYGSQEIELRAKNICGNYGYTESDYIYLDYCYYYGMDATSYEGSLDESNGAEINSYPNPADQDLTIDLDESQNGSEVILIDESRNIRVKAYGKKDKVQMDVSLLPAGTYYLVVTNKKGKSVKRIIVN